MKLRQTHRLIILVAIFFLVLAQIALAHAPFDCSARVIVHADSAEVMLTVGTALGENFLRPANISPGQLPAGHPFALAPGFAINLFTASADGQSLPPREADVITDGIEFQFHFEYALAPARSLGIGTHFIPALKPPRVASLVLTDENGNLLASAILSPGKDAAAPVPAASRPRADSPPLAANQKNQPGFGGFLKLGIGHILNVAAFDHLLFLTALLLGCQRLKPMLLVITGFTLAHSLTLALAALNLVTISPRIIEPAIAASILFVAVENFRRTEKSWHRYALTCGFGLIHGFGFAGALRTSGLAEKGVEIGQLTVAAVLLPILFVLQKHPWFWRFGVRAVSAGVMLVAAWWLVARIASSGE